MNGTAVSERICPPGTLFDSTSSSCMNANLVSCGGNTSVPLVTVNNGVLRTGYVPQSAFVCNLSNASDTTCKLRHKKKNKFFRYATASPADAVDWTASGYVTSVKFQEDCREFCPLSTFVPLCLCTIVLLCLCTFVPLRHCQVIELLVLSVVVVCPSSFLLSEGCWAFSVASAVESVQCINDGLPCRDLSTQQLLDCMTPYHDNCKGGDPSDALEYIARQGGLTYLTDYPLLDPLEVREGVCNADAVAEMRSVSTNSPIIAWEKSPALSSMALMKVVSNQPAVIFISSSWFGFWNYTSAGPDDPNVRNWRWQFTIGAGIFS